MLNRIALLFVAGAAMLVVDASASSGQDTTRARTVKSTRRIPLSKEAPGEVTIVRVDTVTVHTTDTLTMVRVDTVTNVRVDTVVRTVTLAPRKIGGAFFGIAGGGAWPYGAIRSVNQAGWLGQVQAGYQPLNSWIGVRGDVSLTQYSHDAAYAFLGSRPLLWNANLDGKLSIPFLGHTFGSNVLFSPYLIGGGSYVAFRNLRMRLDTDAGFVGGIPPLNAVIAGPDGSALLAADDSYHSNWGWNAGGGLSFHVGSKEWFLEMRGIHFNHGDQFGSSWHVPLIFGVNFF
jgi:hypothetical protein